MWRYLARIDSAHPKAYNTYLLFDLSQLLLLWGREGQVHLLHPIPCSRLAFTKVPAAWVPG